MNIFYSSAHDVGTEEMETHLVKQVVGARWSFGFTSQASSFHLQYKLWLFLPVNKAKGKFN